MKSQIDNFGAIHASYQKYCFSYIEVSMDIIHMFYRFNRVRYMLMRQSPDIRITKQCEL